MNLKRTAAPAVEPVEAPEVELHLGISEPDWHWKITDELIPGARQQVEDDTARALITQTWVYRLDAWPCGDIELPIAPVTAVSEITYRLSDGVTVVTLPATVYDVDPDSEPARVFCRYGQVWPAAALHPRGAIAITFTAGYGDAGASVPARLKQAMLLLAGHRFADREGAGGVVAGYEALIDPYRLPWKRVGS